MVLSLGNLIRRFSYAGQPPLHREHRQAALKFKQSRAKRLQVMTNVHTFVEETTTTSSNDTIKLAMLADEQR